MLGPETLGIGAEIGGMEGGEGMDQETSLEQVRFVFPEDNPVEMARKKPILKVLEFQRGVGETYLG